MMAQRLADDLIRIPTYDETPDGTEAHGTDDIGPDDPRYARYDTWLRQQEAESGVSDD